MQKSTPWPNQNNPDELLAKYDARKATADYLKNQSICVQGRVADAVYLLQKGRVKVTVTLKFTNRC